MNRAAVGAWAKARGAAQGPSGRLWGRLAGFGDPALQQRQMEQMTRQGGRKKGCRAGTPLPASQAELAAGAGRKHLRRLDRVFDDVRGPVFFITCCVRDRQKVLADGRVAHILVEAWQTSPEVYGWFVGRYVVMPDHVHFFAGPRGDEAKSLSQFLASWKRWTRRCMREQGGPGFAWQREFFDHLLRSDESYEQKWEYVRANPVRAGLVSNPDEWPYQGELAELTW
jgi:putative transposase